MKKNFGSQSTSEFLQKYWQKKPLLMRDVFPDFKNFMSKESILSLASKTQLTSRLIANHNDQWTLSYGPFKKKYLRKLPKPWALLIENLNSFIPAAQTLLNKFNFIPYARLDDVMVSFAPDRGGVGPHIDSYDVFLLQGSGSRIWQISKQKDLSILPDNPLRILKKFTPTHEWLLEPGDILYLPPHYAHNGIAVGDCITYSIGFRAPSHQELINEFLMYLQDTVSVKGRYKDPTLQSTRSPAAIPRDMIENIYLIVKKIQFDKNHVSDFLGKYLTEPKATIFFEDPFPCLSEMAFLKRASKQRIFLNLKTQLLFYKSHYYINGEHHNLASMRGRYIKLLANNKELALTRESRKLVGDLLYEWYLKGFIGF